MRRQQPLFKSATRGTKVRTPTDGRRSENNLHRLGKSAEIFCLCGNKIVRQSWEDFRAGVPARCDLDDCDDPDKELTREPKHRQMVSKLPDAR